MVSSNQIDIISKSDTYKRVMKPLLERKRRARINKCLDELRDLLVSVLQAEGEAVTRLEKADILEHTVRHVRKLSERRRLAIPSPSVKLQQDQEDVARFKEGFVAAARQVQNFFLRTNAVESSVSNNLISHLSHYATSFPSPQPLAINKSPSPPIAPVQPPHVQNHPTAPVSTRPQIYHQSPAAPQYVIKKSESPCNSPVQQYAVPQNPQIKVHQAPVREHVIHQTTKPVNNNNNNNTMPPPFPPTNKPVAHQTQQLPLMDLSNRQLQHSINNNTSGPIIRDVKIEDRTVAPSPFIDVVSTDDATFDEESFVRNLKREVNYNTSPADYDISKQLSLQLQAKVVASISVSQERKLNLDAEELKNHMYALASQKHYTSAKLPTAERLSPIPQDLSMKRQEGAAEGRRSPSWRPWSQL